MNKWKKLIYDVFVSKTEKGSFIHKVPLVINASFFIFIFYLLNRYYFILIFCVENEFGKKKFSKKNFFL
jgi:hypothetical protein